MRDTETYTYTAHYVVRDDSKVRIFSTSVTILSKDPFTDVLDIGSEALYLEADLAKIDIEVVDEGAQLLPFSTSALRLVT